ncbi:hypothetical protein HanPI659440_Chr00c03g0709211 [Helianthus annuus]|nr:hypothetical protein HanPI659440_Chr00c03g0709211 [Helianthus annuus]
MIIMIAASVYTITKIIFLSTFTRNDLLRFNRFLSSSHDCWNSIGYPLSNDIFNILSSHILVLLVLLRLILFINWFIISVFHLMIFIYINY